LNRYKKVSISFWPHGVDSGLGPDSGAQPLYVQLRNLPTEAAAMRIVMMFGKSTIDLSNSMITGWRSAN
jgi:hypothetical protein